ncbi:uncharacterized protein EDB91DRAFT_1244106 [Suillus paluster]|uniref:uncharacterized protein n=1 Tax=Suillus paluster TaxID=48578 RepID=UPI001B85F4CC|nr:uncharacterized protein EDB91DRAFT_1244106 [Suillus paluster]KAG1750525.1 hypothetical protein EDB91DRAFT_1244106 [Suillus paluster]
MYQLSDDSKFVTIPPSYNTISTSADPVQCPPSICSLLQTRQKQKAVLSRIRDIVSSPDFTPSSVAPAVSACAADLPAAVFSYLLQTPNIEGHTALYWAIVNDRREAFSAFIAFIPRFSSVCASDLRLACMATNDQALFAHLNLGNFQSLKDEPLRRSLGCPPDEVQVYEGNEPNKFVACIRIRMFQKR